MASNEMDPRAVDADLLTGCRAGDRSAQRRLYDMCHSSVYRVMVRMVGAQEADDLTQQVFLQVFRKMDQFAEHAEFATWLYRLAMNEALQQLRRRHRWRFLRLRQKPTSRATSPMQREEDRELLDRALLKIDPELRATFVLREIEGQSYREISDTLGVPPGTVGSRLNRARRELQQRLAELGWKF